MHFYELANHLEAVLWTTMGVGFFVYLPWTPRAKRGRCVLAAVVLIAFGASDIFDAESGAWWRPWWLLLWKAGCVAVLGLLTLQYFRERSRARRGGR